MNQPYTVTYTTVTSDEPLVAVYAEDLVLCADLLGFIEDWLLHAQPETLADLNQFTGPGYRNATRLTEELGERAAHLHRLAQGSTR